ncbi:MAG: DNA-binding protein WhiA, partial [Tissierellia bacterium]|nr:DNA-binding protein WhiA [Tissierellia bacterium]
MSFSNELKSEAAKIKTDTFNLILAELSAYVRTCGELKLKDGSWILEFVTENASIARRIFTFLKSYTQNLEIYRKKSNQLNKRSNYIIIMKDRNSIDDLLYDTGFVKSGNYDEKNYKIDKGLLQIDEEIRAFLRASFLGAGSVTDPEKGYHLELISQNEELAMDLKDMINKWNLNAKIATRKSSFIVYLKEAEQIS